MEFATFANATLPSVLAAVASAVSACLALLLALRIARHRPAFSSRAAVLPEGISFVFHGQRLLAASREARSLIAPEVGGTPAEALIAALARRGQDLSENLATLIAEGRAFAVESRLNDGRQWLVEGRPQGGMIGVTIRDLTQTEARAQILSDTLETTTKERERLGTVMSVAPFCAWQMDAAGKTIWSNDAYQRLVTAAPANADALRSAAQNAGAAQDARLSLSSGSGTVWFDVSLRPGPEESSFAFALPADTLVATEDALHRFVATLGETFAHLSVGLAVFDEGRRLHLFNPALADLLGLPPDWMARQPAFEDMMERLRERQILPHSGSYAKFRERLAKMDADAAAGTLSELWVQPSGRTLRVSGRPHPKNSVALMIEDITDTLTLEREYAAQIQLGRSALDCVSDAVAIFNLSGEVSYANRAFATLWGLPDAWRNEPLQVQLLANHCATRTEASPFWARLSALATSGEDRQRFAAEIQRLDGASRSPVVTPRANGSNLVVFRAGESGAGATGISGHARTDWATHLFREAVETAADAFGTPSPIEAQLRAVLQEGTAVQKARPASVPRPQRDALHAQLHALAADKELGVRLSVGDTVDLADLSQSARFGLLSLFLAVKSLSVKGAILDVALEAPEGGMHLKVATSEPGAAVDLKAEQQSLPLRILSRFARTCGTLRAEATQDGGSALVLWLDEAGRAPTGLSASVDAT